MCFPVSLLLDSTILRQSLWKLLRDPDLQSAEPECDTHVLVIAVSVLGRYNFEQVFEAVTALLLGRSGSVCISCWVVDPKS